MLKNCQDAVYYKTYQDDSLKQIIGVVCDGCGSSPYSEIGAHIIAKSILNNLIGRPIIRDTEESTIFYIQHVLRKLVEYDIRMVIDVLDKYKKSETTSPQTIYDYFLSTAVCFIVENDNTIIFSSGDGVYSVNGETTIIDQDNCPSYLAYGLIASSLKQEPEKLDFTLNETLKTSDIQSLIIGTDGVGDIIKYKEESYISLGNTCYVDGLEQFTTKEIYRKKNSAIQKRLTVLSDKGFLKDDTSMIVLIKNEETNDSNS